MKRDLTTAYHPQGDSQTAIMNQTLEISLRAYVGSNRNNWVSSLNGLSLSYNSTPHTAIGFTPAYLLRRYVLVTSSSLIHSPENIYRYPDFSHSLMENGLLHPDAFKIVEPFNAERQQAQEALLLGQYCQKQAYNKGQLSYKFEEGVLVLINPHSLSLLRSEKG